MTTPQDTVPFIIDSITNAHEVCYQYATESELASAYPAADGTLDLDRAVNDHWQSTEFGYRRMAPMLSALIFHGYSYIGLADFNAETFEEWLYRINILFDSGVTFMTTLVREEIPTLCPECNGTCSETTPDGTEQQACSTCQGIGCGYSPIGDITPTPYRPTRADLEPFIGLFLPQATVHTCDEFDDYIRKVRTLNQIAERDNLETKDLLGDEECTAQPKDATTSTPTSQTPDPSKRQSNDDDAAASAATDGPPTK
jgi:hypothetical protein